MKAVPSSLKNLKVMSRFFNDRLLRGFKNRYPLIYVKSRDERRLLDQMGAASLAYFGDDRPLVTWSCMEGSGGEAQFADPVRMLAHIRDRDEEVIYLLKDFPALFDDQPQLTRALRDLYEALHGSRRHVVLSYPEYRLPIPLQAQTWFVDLGMPDGQEISNHLEGLIRGFNRGDRLDEAWIGSLINAMKGLDLEEITHLFYGWDADDRFDLSSVLEDVYANKTAALQKEGCLQFISKRVEVDDVGGLENLKEWVMSRKQLFDRQTIQDGVPMPAGILFMGISGCGKSMAAKVIAGAWNLPLIRLDMNLVMSGAYGTPEFAFDHALRTAENIAPLVLWIDEMENSFGYDGNSSGGNNSIFSTFLTWLQEKPPQVFVVATANRIERLPAEVIRKGRFDQLFFLDLPTDEERRAIFRIHIEAYGGDPDTFNMNLLSIVTKDWSGAEIEQAVKASRIHAYQEGRMFDEKDITYISARMVPLSRTMEEQIKHLRQWSQTRATPASKRAA